MNDVFNWKYYLKKYKDLRDANINTYDLAFHHWNKYGKKTRYCNIETDPNPYICHIYIISPIKTGGSHKYITDIINYLDKVNINYIHINNVYEYKYMHTEFTNKDILFRIYPIQKLHLMILKNVYIKQILI